MLTDTPLKLLGSMWDVDWALNLAVALDRCEEVRVYPEQITLARTPGGPTLSFVHGMAGGSGLGSINFVQDKRKRRALMERAGVAIPRGASFTWRNRKNAAKFANKIKFPVTIKPASGDNGSHAQLGISNFQEFQKALENMAVPPAQRKHHLHSTYRLQLLREPEIVDGELVLHGGYRLLVEKHLEGVLYRVVVIGGKALSVTACDGSPSDGSYVGGVDVTAEVSPEVLDLAEKAASAIPKIPNCSIDIVELDEGMRGHGPAYVVVDYHERIGLWVQAMFNVDLARSLAKSMFDQVQVENGQQSGSEEKRVARWSIRLDGAASVDEAKGVVAELAEAIGVLVSDLTTDERGGSVEGNISGDSLNVAVFLGKVLEAPGDGPRFTQIRLGAHQ